MTEFWKPCDHVRAVDNMDRAVSFYNDARDQYAIIIGFTSDECLAASGGGVNDSVHGSKLSRTDEYNIYTQMVQFICLSRSRQMKIKI